MSTYVSNYCFEIEDLYSAVCVCKLVAIEPLATEEKIQIVVRSSSFGRQNLSLVSNMKRTTRVKGNILF